MKVLTLCWDKAIGESYTNLDALDKKLFGIEKADFLDDAIDILMAERAKLDYIKDYEDGMENATE